MTLILCQYWEKL